MKRLYSAVCAILEAKAESLKPVPAPKPEHRPEGNNFSATERRGPLLEPYEMHGQYRPDSYGNQISLRWWPKEEEAPRG